MEVITLIYILFIHWVADFIFQSDYMAQNKSKDNKALLVHGFVYHIPFWLISPLYAIVNGIIHTIIDFVTSRITSKLYSKNEIHWFFTVIGFDQFLHVSTLIITYKLLM